MVPQIQIFLLEYCERIVKIVHLRWCLVYFLYIHGWMQPFITLENRPTSDLQLVNLISLRVAWSVKLTSIFSIDFNIGSYIPDYTSHSFKLELGHFPNYKNITTYQVHTAVHSICSSVYLVTNVASPVQPSLSRYSWLPCRRSTLSGREKQWMINFHDMIMMKNLQSQ